jgi:hypothetical protein
LAAFLTEKKIVDGVLAAVLLDGQGFTPFVFTVVFVTRI